MVAETLDDLFIFAGESNIPLAEAICEYLGIPLQPTHFTRFSNDNLWIQLGTSVRNKDVYLVQSLTPPVQDHLFQLMMMLNVASTGGASQVTAVIPYYSYGRSDKKDAPRVCITARLAADLITTAGADRVITMALHSDQVHGFFKIPLDHLTSLSVLSRYFQLQDLSDTVLVSPDVGYAKKASQLANWLNIPLAVGTKVRLGDTQVEINEVLGSGELGRRAIIIDDEIATGGTMVKMAWTLHEKHGVEDVTLVCTHGLFAGNAINRIKEVPFVTEVVTTDTVLAPHAFGIPNLHVETIAPVLAEGIRCNHLGQSVGSLFAFWQEDTPKEVANKSKRG
ncbi:MAG: ribose-phosphate diphosphokinase [Chloroflexi bacterium]|nr:ribose-phosphate diphosphokinase [Chloroflexota bacterium]